MHPLYTIATLAGLPWESGKGAHDFRAQLDGERWLGAMPRACTRHTENGSRNARPEGSAPLRDTKALKLAEVEGGAERGAAQP